MKRIALALVLLSWSCAQGLPEEEAPPRYEPDAAGPGSMRDAGPAPTSDVGGETDSGPTADVGPDEGPDCEPIAELCGNGVDDDCDGETDEGFETIGNRCSNGIGACENSGFIVCSADGTEAVCDAEPADPGLELCGNMRDDDCDGETDEGFDQIGDACTAGEGACEVSGTLRCNADGTNVSCDAQPLRPQKEICGNSIDDDCDGEVDEDFEMVGDVCTLGEGICEAVGVWECDGDLMVRCTAIPGDPEVEICGNGVDEDCDGTPDNGFPNLGQACETTLNNCTATGTYDCDGTTTTCNASITISNEVCDGQDQDCNWQIDEGGVCGTCTDDGFEPNDFRERATNLDADTRHNLTSCHRNPDWFTLENVPAGERLVVNVTFDHDVSDLDIELLDASGTSIATSASNTSNEQIRHITTTGGDLTLLVAQFGTANALPYSVYWYTESSTNQCVDDVFEQNDTVETSVPIDIDTGYAGQVCSGDLDFYDLGFLTSGFGIAVNVAHDVAVGDLDVRLYRYGAEIASIATTDDDEFFVFWPPYAGEYELLVEGPGGVENNYGIAFIAAGGYVCASDDSHEPDDVAADAVAESELSSRFGTSCNNPDWIRMSGIEAGDSVTASLRFAHQAGDLDLRIYPEGGPYDPSTLVGQSISATDDEFIEFVAPTAGDYVAVVDGFAMAENTYRFVWDRNLGCSDRFESNNRFSSFPSLAYGTSYPLAPEVTHTGLSLCGGDFDNYELGFIGPGRTITVTTTGTAPGYEVEIFQNLTGVSLNDDAASSTKVTTWTTTTSDEYTLAIRPLSTASLTYSVLVEIE